MSSSTERCSDSRDAHGETKRRERYRRSVELVLVDSADREWKLSAEGLTTFPWQCWPNMVSFNVLGRWRCGRSRRLRRDPGLLRNAPTDRAKRGHGDARARVGLRRWPPSPSSSISTARSSRRARPRGRFSRASTTPLNSASTTQQEYFRLLEDNLFQGIRRLCRDDAQSQTGGAPFSCRAGGPLPTRFRSGNSRRCSDARRELFARRRLFQLDRDDSASTYRSKRRPLLLSCFWWRSGAGQARSRPAVSGRSILPDRPRLFACLS